VISSGGFIILFGRVHKFTKFFRLELKNCAGRETKFVDLIAH
jgi:hypothetical protein